MSHGNLTHQPDHGVWVYIATWYEWGAIDPQGELAYADIDDAADWIEHQIMPSENATWERIEDREWTIDAYPVGDTPRGRIRAVRVTIPIQLISQIDPDDYQW